MKRHYLGIIALGALGLQNVYAENIKANENDTIKTYNMGEVIVTSSTKETNNLRTLPGSVSILSPQMISGRQIDALKDISSFVPNLYMPDYGAKLTSAIYIRGIGARSSGQSVGLYVDNVPYLDKSTFDFELTDIQRIEVLRGPQGTLYGRNAMGGIVNIYTISPFDYQGKKLSLSAGSYGQYKVKASHYAKLSETIGFTAAAYYDHSDGFYTNAYDGKKIDKEDNVGGRFKLEGRFNPNFRASYSLSVDYTDQGAFPYGMFIGTGNTDHKYVNPININDPSSYKRTVIANNLSLEYRNEHVILSSITGHQYFKDDMKMDQDFSPLSIFTLNQKQKQNAFSEELAIKSNTRNNYQWSFGLYGFYDDLHTDGPVDFKEDGIKTVLQPVFDQLKKDHPKMPYLKILDDHLYIPGSFDTPSYGLALYHQSTYNNLFTEGLSITAGIRLDYEKQKMDYNSEAKMRMGFGFVENGPVIDIEKLFPIPTTVMDASVSQDFWQVLPKISLKYECSPNTFTYVSVAKGYKTGGYNVQMSADVMQSQMQYDMMSAFKDMMPIEVKEPTPIEEVAAYKPEKSWNYEVGAHLSTPSHKVQADLALFYIDCRDQQLTVFPEGQVTGRLMTNAGRTRSFGGEASLLATLWRNLDLQVAYGYTRATFVKFDTGKADYAGNFIPYAPQHTLYAGASYTLRTGWNWLEYVIFRVAANGAGRIYWNEANTFSQPFYALLEASIRFEHRHWAVDVWGRNLTDTRYDTFYFMSIGNSFLQRGRPRTFGVSLSITL